MSETPQTIPPAGEAFFGAHVVQTLRRYQRQILFGTAAVTALAIFGGGAWYAVLQPARRTFTLQFSLGFGGQTYPNGLRFSSNDLVAPSVMEEVYKENGITYCDVEQFRAGFFVDEKSFPVEVLDEEFRLRLSEPRITAVERDRIMTEYRQRRATLPTEHRLTLVVPDKCAGIPDVVATKVLNDVLVTWAKQSEARRGVLRLQVGALTPALLNSSAGTGASLVVRADLLRRALMSTLSNMGSVQGLPGAEFVRLPDSARSFREISAELELVLRARVDPLVAAAVAVSPDATNWLRDALEGSESRRAANVAREQSYLLALREYSGTNGADAPRVGQPRGRSEGAGSDVGALTPQIDGTFLDRLIEMAGANSEYRQTLTGKLVEAGLNVAAADVDVRYYRWLMGARRSGASAADVQAQLDALTAVAKKLMDEYNLLHEHYTLVSLRPDSELFTVVSAPSSSRLIGFTKRSYLLLVVSAFLGSLVLGALAAVAYSRRKGQA